MNIQRQWGVVLLCLLGMALSLSFVFAFSYPADLLRIFGVAAFVGCFFVLVGK